MKRLSIIPLAVLAVAPVSTVTAQESALKPALIGLGVGAGLGFLVGYVLTLGEHEGDPLKTCGLGERGGCILIGTAIGGGVGALFGLSYHTIFNNDAAPKALKIPAGAFLGLVVGAVPGALIGQELESKAREAMQRGDELKHICDDVDCVLLGTAILGGLGLISGVVAAVIEDQPGRGGFRMDVTPERDGRWRLSASVRF